MKIKKFKCVIAHLKQLDKKKLKNNDNKDNDKKKIENSDNTISNKYTFDSSDSKEIMTGIGGEGSAYPDSDKYIVEDLKKVIKKEESEVSEENDVNNNLEQSNKNNNNWPFFIMLNSWLIWIWKRINIYIYNWRKENSLWIYIKLYNGNRRFATLILYLYKNYK